MLKLIQTCGACPEQYDVYLDADCIGYMRLRHGYFRAEYRDTTVYTCSPKGDGCFKDDERVKYLNEACRAIIKAHENINDDPLEEPIYEMETST